MEFKIVQDRIIIQNMIVPIILIIIPIVLSMVGIIYVLFNLSTYETKWLFILIVILFMSDTIIYITSFILSTFIIFNEDLTLTIWKCSIIFRLISSSLLTSVHSFILEYNKRRVLPIFLFSFLGGTIFSLIFFQDSMEIVRVGVEYVYIINNIYLCS